jgi:hypothetical protein
VTYKDVLTLVTIKVCVKMVYVHAFQDGLALIVLNNYALMTVLIKEIAQMVNANVIQV